MTWQDYKDWFFVLLIIATIFGVGWCVVGCSKGAKLGCLQCPNPTHQPYCPICDL